MNPFTAPARLPLIAPSILAADFARMAEECADVMAAGADLLHLDVMDGHFVPNLTMGPDLCRAIHRALPAAFLDVHLMVSDPAAFVTPFIRAGAGNITFHCEVVEPETARRLCDRIRSEGATAGIAINPPTPVERILPACGAADLLLLMSVNPGFGGQAFIYEILAKAAPIRNRMRAGARIEIDGGITHDTAGPSKAAGVEVLVAGSSIFSHPRGSRAEAIDALRRA